MNIPYGRQSITQEDIDIVTTTLQHPYLTQGPAISSFEEKFSSYVDAKYSVMCSNGTAALHLALLALDVKPNDKVITTSNSFVATSNCIRYCGGEVHFVDIDPETFLIDLDLVEKLLEKHPPGTFKGLIAVDFAGYPLDGERVSDIAKKHNLWTVEDACHAPGAKFLDSKNNWQKAGNGKHFDMTVFSFHPVKHIAAGEGGAISTNNSELNKKLRLFRSHGITKDPSEITNPENDGWYYEMQELGYNYRITDIQAALAESQLSRADDGLVKRNQIAERYNIELKDIVGLKLPSCQNDSYHAYHLYIVQTKNRKELYDFLRENKIYSQIHYIPIHLQPYYKNLGWKKGDLPVVEGYYDSCLSIPMFPSMREEEQTYVIQKLKEFFN